MKLQKCNILRHLVNPSFYVQIYFSTPCSQKHPQLIFTPQHVTLCATHTKHPVKLWLLYFNCVYGLSSQLDF